MKKSINIYFYTLTENGYLNIVDHKGRENIYELSELALSTTSESLKNISDEVYDNIIYELGEEIGEIVKNDKYVDGLDIMNFSDEIDKPIWLR